MSGEVMMELSEGRIARAHSLLLLLPFISHSTFLELLNCRFYSSAILYSSLDSTPQQLLLASSLSDILSLCLKPSSIEVGLFFLMRFREDNRDEDHNREIVRVCEEILDKKVIVYAMNPLSVAVSVIYVLMGVKKRVKAKVQKRWERFVTKYDHKAFKRLKGNYYRYFDFLLLSGQSIAKVIMTSHNSTLMSLKGLQKAVKVTWNGPHLTVLWPASSFITGVFHPHKTKKVSFWSYRNFYESPKCRFYCQLFTSLITIAAMQFGIEMKYPVAKIHIDEVEDNNTSTQLPIDSYDYFLTLAVVLAITDCCYEVNKALYYRLRNGTSLTLGLSQVTSVLILLSACYFLYGSSWFSFISGVQQMSVIGIALALFVIETSFRLITCLRVIGFFAHITNSLIIMLQKSLAFVLILFLLLYAYASQYLMFNLSGNPWGEDIGKSLYYSFVLMLGNLPLDKELINKNIASTISLFLFIIATTVIMLNLLVAVLSEVYFESRLSVKRIKTELIWKHCECMKADRKFAWLSCALPPFSLVSLIGAPIFLCFPTHSERVSQTWIRIVYCCSLFPCGVLWKVLIDLVLLLPCFVLSYRRCQYFFECRSVKVSEGDFIPLEVNSLSVRWIALWTLFGIPFLLKRLLQETIQFAASLLTIPSFRPNITPLKHSCTTSEGQINHPTDCSLDPDDQKDVDIEVMTRSLIGFEGETELIRDICSDFDHFGSMWLKNRRFVKQTKALIATFHPDIVYSALFHHKVRKVIK